MAPFVALKPAAPITINVPPYFAKDRLNCNTQRWGGGNFFTGNPHDDLSKRPLVIDIFIVASEMDLMEARLWELYESVDYVIVGISPKNHRGDPQPNWFQHANEKQNRFTKGKIFNSCFLFLAFVIIYFFDFFPFFVLLYSYSLFRNVGQNYTSRCRQLPPAQNSKKRY